MSNYRELWKRHKADRDSQFWDRKAQWLKEAETAGPEPRKQRNPRAPRRATSLDDGR